MNLHEYTHVPFKFPNSVTVLFSAVLRTVFVKSSKTETRIMYTTSAICFRPHAVAERERNRSNCLRDKYTDSNTGDERHLCSEWFRQKGGDGAISVDDEHAPRVPSSHQSLQCLQIILYLLESIDKSCLHSAPYIVDDM